MDASVKREELLHGLYLVQGVVERRTPQPVLAHVLIEADDVGLALTATDLEVGLRTRIAGSVKRPGAVTANARKLYEIAREVSADDVGLRSGGVGWVELHAGRSKFKVVSLDPKDYPPIPLGQEAAGTRITLAAGTLREMIDKTLFAVSTDETRFNLSGVYLESSDSGLRMVATDGHRLSVVERTVKDARLARGVIMPRKGLVEVRKLLEQADDAELTLVVTDKDVRLQAPQVEFFMRLVEGEFPDYRQVVPSGSKAKVRMNREDVLSALRRIALLASERSHGVKLQLDKGTLEIAASNPEQGEASEDIEVSYAGPPLTIGFNARYLLEVLTVHAAGDVIEMGLTDEVGPGTVVGSQDPSFTYVLMPMRL
jgi:DNA polymerase-3 subunit beta